MNYIFKITILLFLISLGSCIEPLNIDFRGDSFARIVIIGEMEIGDSESRIIVKLDNLDGFSSSLQRLSGAVVTVFDSSNNSFEMTRTDLALYDNTISNTQPNGFNLAVGEIYTLEVRLADGVTYRSTPEPALDVADVERIEYSIRNGIIDYRVVANTEVNGVKNRLKWDLERTFKFTDCAGVSCYFSNGQGVNNALITDPAEINQDQVSFEVNGVPLGGIALEGHYLTVRQKALSSGAAEYWTQVNLSINRDGDMFEPVAGKTVTNLFNANDENELVDGYFHASKVNQLRVFVSAEEQGFTAPFCPRFDQIGRKIAQCFDCTTTNGASLDRPVWYID